MLRPDERLGSLTALAGRAPDCSEVMVEMLKWLTPYLMADVAQLVEPRIVIPVVAGSIPVVRPNRLYNLLIFINFYQKFIDHNKARG